MMSLTTGTVRDDDRPVLRLELERDATAPSLARAAIAGFCQERAVAETTIATLMLLVSEVVTNAVIHPRIDPPGAIAFFARMDERMIRVEVSDEGAAFTPRPRDPGRLEGGYGLYLLEHQAASWGVAPEPHTTVWFEVTRAAD